MEFQFTILDMRIKPLILLFFVWLLWGGYVIHSVNSQTRDEQIKRLDEKMAAQGQVLQWFFQERTLALKGMKDDEPVVARFASEDWKKIDPWKAVAYLKDRTSTVYGPFEKIMPDAHKTQLLERLKKSVPAGRIEGVHWEAFQWNGTPLVLAYVTRAYGTQVFVAQASDWGRSLSLLSSESGWTLANQAGTYIFHSDVRYVGEQRPVQAGALKKDLQLSSTNLVATLSAPKVAASSRYLMQVGLVSLGFFLISWVIMSQYLRGEKTVQLQELEALKGHLQTQYTLKLNERLKELKNQSPQPEAEKQELFFRDLSHRVAASLGRQLQPSFVNILGHSLWLESVSKERSTEEQIALGAVTREARASKEILDKLLSVAGESDLEKFPMKLETPILRALKRWDMQFNVEHVRVEKNIVETSFYPIHSKAIEKALDHFFQNALEAMTRQIDKVLTVTLHDDLDYLYLNITDNGVGIEPENLGKISDPFFTTKAHMSKLGLGLTEAFGLLKQHHAIISVTSEMGHGTRFEIRFDKNEAQKVLEISNRRKEEAEFEGQIIVPLDLPQPLEPNMEDSVPVLAEVEAVDQEIERILDIDSLDFIESPESQPRESYVDESLPSDENLLDENPIRGPHA